MSGEILFMKKGIESEWKKMIVQKLTESLLLNVGDISTMLYYTVSVGTIKDIKVGNQYDDMKKLADNGNIPVEFKRLMDELSDICYCDNPMNRRGRFLYNLKVLYNDFGSYMPECISDWKVLARYLLICAVNVDMMNRDYERIRYLTLYFTALFKIRYSNNYIDILRRCTLCGVEKCIHYASMDDAYLTDESMGYKEYNYE